jgi:hypothetical protein
MKACFATVAVLLIFLSGCSAIPTDADLELRFRQSHADFEKLREMIDEDNLVGRVHAEYADPHISAARLAEYRKLMAESGIIRLWGNGRSNPFELIVGMTGFLSQGEYKGYEYDPSGPQRIADSLDTSCFDIREATITERTCSAKKSLGDGWWLLRYEYR